MRESVALWEPVVLWEPMPSQAVSKMTVEHMRDRTTMEGLTFMAAERVMSVEEEEQEEIMEAPTGEEAAQRLVGQTLEDTAGQTLEDMAEERLGDLTEELEEELAEDLVEPTEGEDMAAGLEEDMVVDMAVDMAEGVGAGEGKSIKSRYSVKSKLLLISETRRRCRWDDSPPKR